MPAEAEVHTGRKVRFPVNIPDRIKSTVWIGIGLVIIISLLDLIGWIFGINWLKSMGYYWAPMNVVASLCFLITSLALIIVYSKQPVYFKKLGPVIAGVVLIIVGTLTILGWTSGSVMEEGFFTLTPVLKLLISPEHRMPVLSALIFLFIGAIVILLVFDNTAAGNIAHILLFPVTIAGYLIPVSYLLDVYTIHDFYNAPMALNSGISYCAVCLVIYLIRTDSWLMRVFVSESSGGIMARRLFPWLIILPIVIGWFRIYGEKSGVYDSETGVLLVAITYSFCFILLVWFTGRSLNIIDNKRRIADEALKKSYDDLEEKVRERTAELLNLNKILDAEIKERRKAENRLEAERKRIDGLLEIMPAYIILLTPDYHVTYSNKFFRERFGQSGGKKCHQFLFNRSEPCEICETFKVLKDNKSHKWEWTGPDGHIYSIFDFPYNDIDGSPLIMEMGIDITSLKEAESKLLTLNTDLEHRVTERTSALLSANQYLRKTQSMAHLGSWELDLVNDKLKWDEEVYNIFGVKRGEFHPDYSSFLDFIHPDDMEFVNKVYQDSIEKGLDTYEVEHRIIKRDKGEIRYLFEKSNHIRNKSGKVVKSVGMVHDITERKLMELALAKNNERNVILSQTSGYLLASENPLELIKPLCLRVMKFLDCQFFFNFLIDDLNGRLHLNTYFGIPGELAKKVEWIDPGVAVCYSVAADGEGIIAENIPESKDSHTDLLKSLGIKAYACHTIHSGDNVIGTLSFGSNSRMSFSEDETSMMKIVTDQVAIALTRVRNNESLRKSEERYRRLMELSPGASFVNRDNKIVLLNSAAREMLGASSAEEILGKSPFEIFHPDCHQLVRTRIEKILGGESVPMDVEQIVRADGAIRDVEVVAARIIDSEGPAIQVIMNDITERKLAERAFKESKEKLEIALTNGRIGIWEWEINTGLFKLDERMGEMIGLKPGSFENTYDAFEKTIHEEDLPHLRNAFSQALYKEVPLDTIYRIKNKDVDFNYISTKALVEKDRNGSPVKMSGVCFDITEMKRGAEKAMFKLNEDLLRSNKELEQFAYVASHDLQEPLRMVSSFTQLLSQRYKDKLDKDAQDFIQYAVDGAIRMQGLINDLLEYSRVETRGRQFVAVDMHHVLEQVIANLNVKIKEENAIVTAEKLPVVKADEGQMVQLLQNLIGNALKFCNTSPRIDVSAREENEYYLFSVKDNGIGIEPQYFERIFQIFQRLHSKEEYGGTGIGLAICKRIIDRHNGKIWVGSNSDGGSVFCFTILKG